MFRNGLEPWHIILLIVVLVLLFGSKKLPDMSKSVMRSMHIMKTEAKKLRDDDDDDPGQATQRSADLNSDGSSTPHAQAPAQLPASQQSTTAPATPPQHVGTAGERVPGDQR